MLISPFCLLDETDFDARNNKLVAKLPKQGYRNHKLRLAFPKFYRRHYVFFLIQGRKLLL